MNEKQIKEWCNRDGEFKSQRKTGFWIGIAIIVVFMLICGVFYV